MKSDHSQEIEHSTERLPFHAIPCARGLLSTQSARTLLQSPSIENVPSLCDEGSGPSLDTLPTNSPRISSRGRFDTARPRQTAVVQDSWFKDLRILRGRLIERLGVLVALFICAAYLVCHHDQFVEPADQIWTQSLHRLRLGGSLLPSWSRVDWSSYAYVSYVTSADHLCNSVMLAESLHRLGARPDTLILYATDLTPDTQANASTARLLQQATHMYGARVQPVEVLNSPSTEADTMWSQGFTKLLAFNQTRYKKSSASIPMRLCSSQWTSSSFSRPSPK